MEDNTIHIAINPAAGGGRAGQQIETIRDQFFRQFNSTPVIHVTRDKADGFRIGRLLRQSNARNIVIAGGDGTINEVINGLYLNGADTSTKYEIGILNIGSGGDIAQGLGLPPSLSDQITIMAHPYSIDVDLGLVQYKDATGHREQRLFMNEFQLGIGARVVARTSETLKAVGGRLAYALSTIRNGLTYRGPQLNVTLIDGTQFSKRFLGVVISNGTYCGGGMQLTPMAEIDDGQLDLLLMHNMTVAKRLLNFAKIYSGKHIHSKSFTHIKGKEFNITCKEAQQAEMDGELLNLKSCTVQVLHSVLGVKVLSANTTL